MKYLLLFILLTTSLSCTDEKIYLDANGKETSRENALYYRNKPVWQKGVYIMDDYYLSGEKHFKGQTLDSLGTQLDGDATWYLKTGKIKRKENYKNGILVGRYMPKPQAQGSEDSGWEEKDLVLVATTLPQDATSGTQRPNTEHSIAFKEVLAQLQTKDLPLVENTNFDSFIEAEDYDAITPETGIDPKLFQLDQIYPDFYGENSNYKIISAYRLVFSDAFYAVVITVQKSGHEMESLLIHYNLEGQRMDHIQVAYDEIAEGMSRSMARINTSGLTVHQVFWDDLRKIQEVEYGIGRKGEMNQVDKKQLHEDIPNYKLIDRSLQELNLDWIRFKTHLIAVQKLSSWPEEVLIVLPRIKQEDAHYLEVKPQLVLVNTENAKVTHTFYEKATEAPFWTSDAVRLDQISIDVVPYPISDEANAYGIQARYTGSSRVNPYQQETLSLFVKSGDSLKRILHDYEVVDAGGEWDGECEGVFHETKKTISPSRNTSQGYFDLGVHHTQTQTKNFLDGHGDCDSQDEVSTRTSLLTFNGTNYEETKGSAVAMPNGGKEAFSKFHPPKLEDFTLDRYLVKDAYQLGHLKIISGYYQSAAQDETDRGECLVVLDAQDNIIFKSKGAGEVYLYEPHFFRNPSNGKTLIICQLAFEYAFGGDVFMLENGAISPLGNLNVEGYEEDQYLTDIVRIHQNGEQMEFSFEAEKLIWDPGGNGEKTMPNNNLKYIYRDQILKLVRQ
jgi:hypothetical protein